MWIDTHCHLDAGEFDGNSLAIAAQAAQQGVALIVIPAVARANFSTVATLAQQAGNGVYALGIHPMYVAQSEAGDLDALRTAVEAAASDPRFVAIGEIGLDFFLPELKQGELRDKQDSFTPNSSSWRVNINCRYCCMCGVRKTSSSSICVASGYRVALPTLSMAVFSKHTPLSIWVSGSASAVP